MYNGQKLVVRLVCRSPNWMTVTVSPCLTANLTQKLIFCAQPHSHLQTRLLSFRMRGNSWTCTFLGFTTGSLIIFTCVYIVRATTNTSCKGIWLKFTNNVIVCSISAVRLAIDNSTLTVASIINIPTWFMCYIQAIGKGIISIKLQYSISFWHRLL